MLLELNNIFKWVNSGSRLNFMLKDINLQIKNGEFISIMGPLGSGKTTLLNVIGMQTNFNEGEYRFMGKPIHQLKEKDRVTLFNEYMGTISHAYLKNKLAVSESIDCPLVHEKFGLSKQKSLVKDMLDRLNIESKRKLFSSYLNKWQHNTRVLTSKSKHRLILVDEPTTNFNSGQEKEIMKLLKQLNEQGITIIQITHSKKNAAYGSRIIELLGGRIINDYSKGII